MTSARSHRQRLSGNSWWAWILPLLIVAESCFIIKPKPPVIVIPTPDTPDVVIIDTATLPIDTTALPQIIRKDLYRVAVLLPFSIDAKYIANFDYRDRTTPYRTMVAVELYQGMKMALDELQGKGINVQVHVFDTHNSTSEVQRILGQPELKDVDVIVGPLFERSLRLVSDFALANEIFLVSPFSHPKLQDDNPYLICTNASIETHLDAIANMLHINHADQKLLMLRRKDEEEARLNGLLSSRLKALNSPIRPQEIKTEGGTLLPSSALGPDTTIVFCPSKDEAFVNEVLRQLSALSKDYPIILIGMPNWLGELESIRYDYLNALNLHITSNLWIDANSEEAKALDELYRETYGIEASDVVFRGYDLIMWVHMLMKNFGVSFADHFNEIDQSTLFTRFYMLPANHLIQSMEGTPVNYYENQHVQLLRYKEYELVRIN